VGRLVGFVRAHRFVADALVAVALFALWLPVFAPDRVDGDFRERDWASVAFVIATVAPLLWRRRNPLFAWAACWVISILHDLARVPSMLHYVAILVALCAVATYRPRRVSVPAAIITFALTPIDMALSAWNFVPADYFMNLLFTGMTWLFGDHLGRKRVQALEAEQRADQLTQEQQKYAEQMREVLSQYVPAPVVRQLIEGGSSAPLPTGNLTFLMTDVVGSTALWEVAPSAMREAMRRHDEIIEELVSAAGGAIVRPRGEGDSRFAVFVRPSEAVAGAVAIADRLRSEPWPQGAAIRIRTAVHTGTGELRSGDYYGSDVNRCARIRSVAQPGQILVSAATAALLDDQAVELQRIGSHQLNGFSEPELLFEAVVSTSPSAAPAPSRLTTPPQSS
jgi:class 3 adenylate cyclase